VFDLPPLALDEPSDGANDAPNADSGPEDRKHGRPRVVDH